jgi:hypothetical protein
MPSYNTKGELLVTQQPTKSDKSILIGSAEGKDECHECVKTICCTVLVVGIIVVIAKTAC